MDNEANFLPLSDLTADEWAKKVAYIKYRIRYLQINQFGMKGQILNNFEQNAV